MKLLQHKTIFCLLLLTVISSRIHSSNVAQKIELSKKAKVTTLQREELEDALSWNSSELCSQIPELKPYTKKFMELGVTPDCLIWSKESDLIEEVIKACEITDATVADAFRKKILELRDTETKLVEQMRQLRIQRKLHPFVKAKRHFNVPTSPSLSSSSSSSASSPTTSPRTPIFYSPLSSASQSPQTDVDQQINTSM